MHHLTPKETHIDEPNFFQNSYCLFIIDNLLFQSTMAMTGMLHNTPEKLYDQYAPFMDFLS